MADIIDFHDSFNDEIIDPILWPNWADYFGGPDAFREEDGVLHFEGHHADQFLAEQYTWGRFHGSQWEVTFPYSGPQIRIAFGGPATSVEVLWSRDNVEHTIGFINPLGDWVFRTIHKPGTYRFFRVHRNRLPGGLTDSFFLEISNDGTDWDPLDNTGDTNGDLDSDLYPIYVELGGYIDLHDIRGVTVAPFEDGGIDPADPDNDIPDTYIPYVPPDAEAATKTCTSLLDLIREFSAAVRRPVRIINSTTIEMVPTTETIPPGFRNGYADRYYVEDEQNLGANVTVLASNRGRLDLNGRAKFKTDEDLILTTDWRMPQRLPVLEYKNAPVMRVSYSMTPKHFNCEVEFAYATVPAGVKR